MYLLQHVPLLLQHGERIGFFPQMQVAGMYDFRGMRLKLQRYMKSGRAGVFSAKFFLFAAFAGNASEK